jgi:hypothetical protein
MTTAKVGVALVVVVVCCGGTRNRLMDFPPLLNGAQAMQMGMTTE